MDINNDKPVVQRVGQMVQFVVDIQAFPDLDAVKLYWLKNDVLIDANDKHYKTNVKTDSLVPQAYLRIENIEPEDSGTYMLVSGELVHTGLSTIAMTVSTGGKHH